MGNNYKKFLILSIINLLFVMPCFSLDLDSTVNDSQRQNYSGVNKGANINSSKTNIQVENKTPSKPTIQPATVQKMTSPNSIQNTVQETKPVTNPVIEEKKVEIIQDLPKVPSLPAKAKSSTVSPINTQYSGKMPNDNGFIPCNDIVIVDLIIDESVIKSHPEKTKTAQAKDNKTNKTVKNVSYKTALLPKGTQIRAINQSRIADTLVEGQTVVFLSTQELSTSHFKIPKNTKFVARVSDSHRPQITCNGGLVDLKIVSANINGYNQQLDGSILRLKNDRVYFGNLKGQHTYCKTVCKKAKWGQNKFKQWSKTSHQLANKGAGVIIAPFPYLGGCVLAAASTISSPATALLGKGGNLTIPANTTFTIKLNSDARLRY